MTKPDQPRTDSKLVGITADEAVEHARKALRCLHIAVDASVASAVQDAVEQAFTLLKRHCTAAPAQVQPRPPVKCKTCNDWGIVGHQFAVGDGDVDSAESPCPDCPAPAQEAGLTPHCVYCLDAPQGCPTPKSCAEVLERELGRAALTKGATDGK